MAIILICGCHIPFNKGIYTREVKNNCIIKSAASYTGIISIDSADIQNNIGGSVTVVKSCTRDSAVEINSVQGERVAIYI